MRDLLVQPVHGHRVLDQVVGADAEKVHALGQRFRGQRGGRDFNHRAHFHLLVEGHPFAAQLRLALVEQRVGLDEFVEARDHRIHQLHVALDAGAQNGPKLRAENILLLKTEANGAVAEEGIHLRRHIEMSHELVATEIERANDHRCGPQRRRHHAIRLELLLLRRELVAVQEKIFRAEQTHAFRAAAAHLLHVVRALDVRGERELHAVERDRGLVRGVAQLLVEADVLAHELAVLEERLIRGIDDNPPVVAIEQNVLAVAQFGAGLPHADHRRDAQRARHDRGVRGLAPDIGGEAEHVFLVEHRGARRRQIVRHDDVAFLEMLEVEFLKRAEEILQHPLGHVAHVGGTLAEIFVADGFE